jgi:hypothetical protein
MASTSLCDEGYMPTRVVDSSHRAEHDPTPDGTPDQGQRDAGPRLALVPPRPYRGHVQVERHAILDLCRELGLDVYARDLLRVLIDAAEWKGDGRGAVLGFTADGWATDLGYSVAKVRSTMRALEAAGLIAWDRHGGHDGRVRVLVYDDLAPDRDARRTATRARSETEEPNRLRDESAEPIRRLRDESAERPAETSTRSARVEEPPAPTPVNTPSPARVEPVGGSVVVATIDALRDRCARYGYVIPSRLSPTTEERIADRIADGWKPTDLAAALCCRSLPSVLTSPGGFFASRATTEWLAEHAGPPPRVIPTTRPELRDEACPLCDGAGEVGGTVCECFNRARAVTR